MKTKTFNVLVPKDIIDSENFWHSLMVEEKTPSGVLEYAKTKQSESFLKGKLIIDCEHNEKEVTITKDQIGDLCMFIINLKERGNTPYEIGIILKDKLFNGEIP